MEDGWKAVTVRGAMSSRAVGEVLRLVKREVGVDWDVRNRGVAMDSDWL